MPKFLSDILKLIAALVPFVVDAEFSGQQGPEKRAAALAAVNAVIDEPGGINLPAWIAGEFRAWLLGFLIDMLVRGLNRTGFFGKSGS